METNFKPNYAIHPGEFLREEMEEMGISQKVLSEQIGVSKTIINEVLNGKRRINGELAVKLEIALYSPAGFWLNLQALYDETLARIKLGVERTELHIEPIVSRQLVVANCCEYHVVNKLSVRSAA